MFISWLQSLLTIHKKSLNSASHLNLINPDDLVQLQVVYCDLFLEITNQKENFNLKILIP